jgi:hypothetical protein
MICQTCRRRRRRRPVAVAEVSKSIMISSSFLPSFRSIRPRRQHAMLIARMLNCSAACPPLWPPAATYDMDQVRSILPSRLTNVLGLGQSPLGGLTTVDQERNIEL